MARRTGIGVGTWVIGCAVAIAILAGSGVRRAEAFCNDCGRCAACELRTLLLVREDVRPKEGVSAADNTKNGQTPPEKLPSLVGPTLVELSGGATRKMIKIGWGTDKDYKTAPLVRCFVELVTDSNLYWGIEGWPWRGAGVVLHTPGAQDPKNVFIWYAGLSIAPRSERQPRRPLGHPLHLSRGSYELRDACHP